MPPVLARVHPAACIRADGSTLRPIADGLTPIHGRVQAATATACQGPTTAPPNHPQPWDDPAHLQPPWRV